MRLSKIRDKVGYILKTYPATRDSDKALYKWYAELYLGVNETTPFFQVVEDHELNYESLSRARRWFQAIGMYESTTQVAAKRALMEEGYKEEFRGA